MSVEKCAPYALHSLAVVVLPSFSSNSPALQSAALTSCGVQATSVEVTELKLPVLQPVHCRPRTALSAKSTNWPAGHSRSVCTVHAASVCASCGWNVPLAHGTHCCAMVLLPKLRINVPALHICTGWLVHAGASSVMAFHMLTGQAAQTPSAVLVGRCCMYIPAAHFVLACVVHSCVAPISWYVPSAHSPQTPSLEAEGGGLRCSPSKQKVTLHGVHESLPPTLSPCGWNEFGGQGAQLPSCTADAATSKYSAGLQYFVLCDVHEPTALPTLYVSSGQLLHTCAATPLPAFARYFPGEHLKSGWAMHSTAASVSSVFGRN
jgi:hypothetical protein